MNGRHACGSRFTPYRTRLTGRLILLKGGSAETPPGPRHLERVQEKWEPVFRPDAHLDITCVGVGL
jgi:hypothetical protein